MWSHTHERVVFADATPLGIRIVRPRRAPVLLTFEFPLPIYFAEYAAALVAVFLMDDSDEPFTIYTDKSVSCIIWIRVGARDRGFRFC